VSASVDSIDKVRSYYDANADLEMDRLTRHQLEFAVTKRILAQYLPPHAVVADIGGGPGRYAVHLSRSGHAVTLVDLSGACVDLAVSEATKNGTRLDQAIVADARDLTVLSSNHFDAVLCLGPLYHLQQEIDRRRVINECLRVLKKGGIAFFAFISKYGPITHTVKNSPESIAQRASSLKSFIHDGMQSVADSSVGWTDAFFIDPLQLHEIMMQFKVTECGIFGLEGMVAQSEYRIYELGEKITEAWADFLFETGQERSIVAASEHVLYVGRK
jgi:S-adenosylmethionine-dependent methyltransferase